MKVSTATPVLFVDHVEPTRDFFLQLGFGVAFDVPEGGRIGFAMVSKDGVNVMIETRGNTNEAAALREASVDSKRSVVFVEVDDLDAVIAALAGRRVFVERHTTFYKADEITYEEPGGHLVTFAKMDR
jgi:hypothetical protein